MCVCPPTHSFLSKEKGLSCQPWLGLQTKTSQESLDLSARRSPLLKLAPLSLLGHITLDSWGGVSPVDGDRDDDQRVWAITQQHSRSRGQ